MEEKCLECRRLEGGLRLPEAPHQARAGLLRCADMPLGCLVKGQLPASSGQGQASWPHCTLTEAVVQMDGAGCLPIIVRDTRTTHQLQCTLER